MTPTAVLRHRVAAAGRVIDAITSKPIGGAQVAVVEMPKALVQKFAFSGRSITSLKTLTREDGSFYFLDLPDGKYTLEASLPSAGKRYGTVKLKANVKRDDKGDNIVDYPSFALQPTAIKGRITVGAKTALMMAEVQIKGSGESRFSSASGDYLLAGIEPGERTIRVFAQGYRSAMETAVLISPGEVKTLNFQLVKEGK